MTRWRVVFVGAVVICLFQLSAPIVSVGYAEEPAQPQTEVTAAEGDRKKEAEEAKRLQEFYLRNQSVFIRKGEIIAELNTSYSSDKRKDSVQLAAGLSAPVDSTRRFFDTTLFTRFGLFTDGLEFDVIAPLFVHGQIESEVVGVPGSQTYRQSSGVGDLAVAVRYQAWYEKGARPAVIFDVQGKSMTGGKGATTLRGTGNYHVGGGITVMKSLDPVVFFGRVGYTETIGVDGYDIGNIVDFSLGMGFSLNDRVAFNMQMVGATIGKARLQGQTIDGSSLEIMNLLFSSTILMSKQLFIEPIVGIGMTDDAFDATIGLRIPYRF